MRALTDSLQNVISGLGGGSDKSAYNRYSMINMISQGQIDSAYRSSGMCRKVHDLIPSEMCRAGRDWQADDADITLLSAAEKSLQLWAKLYDAERKARLYGGAAILLGVDGQGTPDQPLDPSRIRKGQLKYATVLTCHQLSYQDIIYDPNNPYFGEPEYYMLRNGTMVDPSRVIPVIRQALPNSDLGQYWGDPLLMSLWSSLTSSDAAYGYTAALMAELKSDTISIPGLGKNLTTAEYEGRLMKRVQMAQLFQSMFNVKLIDGGDGSEGSGETWDTRQVALTGIPDLLTAFVARVAAETDIPVTRLSGISPGGMQSTGKGEQQDFEKHIASRQTTDLTPVLDRLDAVMLPSVFGTAKPDAWWSYAPLSQMTESERADVQFKRAQAFQIRVNSGAINADALGEAEVNSMIESGDYPGLEEAVAKHGMEPDEVDSTEIVPEIETIPPAPLNDAAPRTLYVRRDVVNRAEIIKWATAQGFTDIVPDLHVTIIYSRESVDWMKIGEAWQSKIEIGAGGPRLVEPLGDAKAVLLFSSSELKWRNEHMREMGASFDYSEYQPHMTITYGDAPDLATVQPYTGKIVLGPEIFEELRAN
ncbi:MAG TPA: anti-CBASS Acb1 family protein [Gammaproteobacteria bacterium]|nr:anti-CBASS Acb1 family protein [Gammaproteobacteria bacterium]